MKELTVVQERIVDAFLYRPLQFNRWCHENFKNPQMPQSFVSKMLPYRVGIEIACFGSICKIPERPKLGYGYDWGDASITDLAEEKFCFRPFRPLNTNKPGYTDFAIFLNCLEKHCAINSTGDIHVNIDYVVLREAYKKRIGNGYGLWDKYEPYLTEHLFYLRRDVFNYQGGYNRDRVGYNDSAGNMISVCRNSKETTEYRMGRCTFVFADIMKWVFACQEMQRAFIQERQPNKVMINQIIAL